MDPQWNYFSRRHILHPMQRLQQTLHRRNPMQSRKKNLWTQMINENKWLSKHTFLPHVRAQTYIQFFPSYPNQTHTLQKILKTTRICSHFQNKSYKTRSRFLINLTTPDKHHTKWKQNQNRKWTEKNFFFHSAPHFWKSFPFPHHFTS